MCSIEWWHCRWPWVTHKRPQLPQLVHFAPPFIASQRVNLEFPNLVHLFTIPSPTLPMRNLPWKGRGQGHVSNFYIVDLEKISPQKSSVDRWYTQLVRGRFVYDTWDNDSDSVASRLRAHTFMTHCLRLNLQLHTIGLVRTCRISSFCIVAW